MLTLQSEMDDTVHTLNSRIPNFGTSPRPTPRSGNSQDNPGMSATPSPSTIVRLVSSCLRDCALLRTMPALLHAYTPLAGFDGKENTSRTSPVHVAGRSSC